MRVGRRHQPLTPWWECFSVPRTAITPTAGAWLANNFVNVTVPGPTTHEEVLQTLCASATRPIPIVVCCKELRSISLPRGAALFVFSGTYNFASQYQRNPTPPGGAMVLTDWFRYYDAAGPLPRFTSVIQSWDTANKCGELNDYSVCTTWGIYDAHYYLLHVLRQRLNYPDLKRKVIEQIAAYNPRHVIIEDKASGTQLIQDLKSEGVYQIKPYQAPPQTDKIMRLHAQTGHFESGRVLLPNAAPWLAEYRRELTTFPGTKFDDQVDSTTQALDYLSTIGRNLEIWAKLAG